MLRPDQRLSGATAWRRAATAPPGTPVTPIAPRRRVVHGLPPTAATLVVLIGAEILAFIGLRYVFRTAHGG